MKKLTNNVYYVSHNAETDRPVIGLVNGSRYSLVVDAGNSPAHAREILEAIEHLGVNNAKYLAITHWHWDHVFGIYYMNLLTICHQLTEKKLKWMQQLEWDDKSLNQRVASGDEIEFCSSMIKKEMPSREGLILGKGDITFDSKLEIDLGGIACIIENVTGDHAEDSCIVYIPSEKVMFLGDCISPDFYSGARSYSHKVVDMINKIMKYDVDIYIAAHDEPLDKEEVHQYFKELIETQKLTQDIVDMEEAVEAFKKEYLRSPSEDEIDTLQCFINGNCKAI
ncbi:MAG TPA: MBL fold metallo-hydrolase [Patescibacteria group bacterium]|nr:MBL fold metallo-hydrolase [Patescibacteria group bacterium]